MASHSYTFYSTSENSLVAEEIKENGITRCFLLQKQAGCSGRGKEIGVFNSLKQCKDEVEKTLNNLFLVFEVKSKH